MSKTPRKSNHTSGMVQEDKVNKKISTNKIFLVLNKKDRKLETLQELLSVLKEPSNLIDINIRDDAINGSFLHFLTLTAQPNEQISWRMVYALSNVGLDVNLSNNREGTALHLAFKRGYTEVGFNYIEALLKVGSDVSLKNKYNKLAFDYMEQNEQYNTIYNAHTPSIWSAVEASKIEEIYRLMNAWIKVDCRRGDQYLNDYAKQKYDLISEGLHPYNKYAQTVADVLETCLHPNNFVHALFAMDLKKMQELLKQKNFTFNPDMADFCYCYTWYNPVFRNLPRFILEIAFDTNDDAIIKLMLKQSVNVNFLHSKTGLPLFFLAFEKQYNHLKAEIMANAKLRTKSYHGESVLFHVQALYVERMQKKTTEKVPDKEYPQFLLDEFAALLEKDPILISERDGNDLTIVEKILSSDKESAKINTEILFKISLFLQKLTDSANLEAFEQIIKNGFGLVLVNIPIFLDVESTVRERMLDIHRRVTFYKWLQDTSAMDIKGIVNKLILSSFPVLLSNFYSSIRIGDMSKMTQAIDSDTSGCILDIRDYSGRSCLHLTVLYGRLQMTKFLLEKAPHLINTIDNLARTPLHYATATKDTKQIDILLSANADQKIRDCKFLLAEDFKMKEVANDEWFMVKNFRFNESRRVNGIHSFIRCFYFGRIQKAIENNDVAKLAKINADLNEVGHSFKDLAHYRNPYIFVDGKAYEPPLELAMSLHSVTTFRYILENTLSNETKREIKTARLKSSSYGLLESNADKRLKSAKKLMNRELDLAALREIAVLNNLDEFIDVIDNVEEDTEIAMLTGPKLTKADSTLTYKTENANNSEKNQQNSSFVENSDNSAKKLKPSSEKMSTCIIL